MNFFIPRTNIKIIIDDHIKFKNTTVRGVHHTYCVSCQYIMNTSRVVLDYSRNSKVCITENQTYTLFKNDSYIFSDKFSPYEAFYTFISLFLLLWIVSTNPSTVESYARTNLIEP